MLIDVDGLKINYEIHGDGPHTVLCLPGLAGSIELDFGKMLEQVDRSKFTWIAWDPPGYGKSRPPSRDFSDAYLRKDAILAAKLMENLGYKSYSVLGWDQGGATSLFLAAEFPDKVVSVVTLGTHASYNARLIQVYELLSAVELWPQEALDDKVKVYGLDYLKSIMTDNMAAALLSRSSSEHGNYLLDCEERIKCPTLHVNGEADGIVVSGHAFTLESRVDRSRAEIIPEAGHDAHLTHTKEFVELVQEFFEKGE